MTYVFFQQIQKQGVFLVTLIINRAYELRNNQTDAEKYLWQYLRKNQILGLRFKRQHPISTFIADFYCHKIKLVIEIDGEVHLSEYCQEHDDGRTYELERFGIMVIRFTNSEVLNNTVSVLSEIKNRCIQLFY